MSCRGRKALVLETGVSFFVLFDVLLSCSYLLSGRDGQAHAASPSKTQASHCWKDPSTWPVQIPHFGQTAGMPLICIFGTGTVACGACRALALFSSVAGS